MRRIVLAAVAALLFPGGTALADSFPSHPITIVVPFSAGGPSDATGADPGRADAAHAWARRS